MLAASALTLLGSAMALGFDATTQGVIDHYKGQKLVRAADIAELMRASERWCYDEREGQCSWSDIYLDVAAEDARFEISNAWSETVDVSFVDRGVFNDKNQICETGADWTPTVHARSRSDERAISGRELEAIKDEMIANRGETSIDCFDYLYQSADAEAQTVTLLQRQYIEDVHQPDADVLVTIHFDPATALGLKLRW
jgi:hypothetical protein